MRKRIPTVIGLVVLIVGMTAAVFLINRSTHWFSRAAPGAAPKQIKFTNITDSNFSVSWITDEPTSGFLKYGPNNKIDQTSRDDRDELTGKTGNYTTHHITLRNLKPNTIYQFQIGSGGSLFDNNGQNYQLATAATLTAPSPPSDVAYGTINDRAGSPADGLIVYFSLPGAVTQSTLTKSSGNWVIPLNLARSEDLKSYAQYDSQATIEDILVQGGIKGTATAVVTTKNDSPVPTITLGENHDFKGTITTDETDKTTGSSKFNLEDSDSTPSSDKVEIINPEDKEGVSTQKPEIQGIGPVGAILNITIESAKTYTGTIIVDEFGNWNWTPPADLEPGEHTVTINYQDENGQQQILSHTFIVLAAGEDGLPALEATPSGTATPSPTPSSLVSPSPNVSPSGRVSIPSTEGGVPDSGYLTPTFLVFIMGLVLITFGLFSNILLKKKVF